MGWDADAEETDHEDQRVAARSKRPRAEMCWQGRQDMRAVMASGAAGGCPSSVEVMLGFWDAGEGDGDGVRVKSTSSHQSISVMFCTPQFRNHFLLPSGAKKWQLGWSWAISVMVGWERWS